MDLLVQMFRTEAAPLTCKQTQAFGYGTTIQDGLNPAIGLKLQVQEVCAWDSLRVPCC